MPKMLSDGNHKLTWVPDGGIANVAAPTVAELSAGGVLELSCLVTANDFALGPTGDNEINDPALCSESNSTAPGRTNYEGAMNFFRWIPAGEDDAWNTFTGKGIAGYLVHRIGKHHTASYAATDEVQVFGVITGTPSPVAPAADGGYEKFRQMFHVQGEEVDLRAAVA